MDYCSVCVQLEPTSTVKIGNNYYCPYCGNYSLVVTYSSAENPYKKNEVIGHCCTCKGALAELEYKKRKKILLILHERQMQLLKERFETELEFKVNNLVNIKRVKECCNLVNIRGKRNNYFYRSEDFQDYFNISE